MIAHITGDVSEHPRQGPCKGERFTVDAVNAAMRLPQWKQMAIVVTWDDWGGFYESVGTRPSYSPGVSVCDAVDHQRVLDALGGAVGGRLRRRQEPAGAAEHQPAHR